MQFKLTHIAAGILLSLTVASAMPSIEPRAGAVSAGSRAKGPASGDDDVSIQDFFVGHIYTEVNQGGIAGPISVNSIPSSCYTISSPFKYNVTSIQVDPGVACYFYVNEPCAAPYVIVQNGAVAPNLGGTNFDDSLSGYICIAY